MWAAALAGELGGGCRFLWENGATSTISTKNSRGQTPMYAACLSGNLDVNLDVAKWLFEVGFADIKAHEQQPP